LRADQFNVLDAETVMAAIAGFENHGFSYADQRDSEFTYFDRSVFHSISIHAAAAAGIAIDPAKRG